MFPPPFLYFNGLMSFQKLKYLNKILFLLLDFFDLTFHPSSELYPTFSSAFVRRENLYLMPFVVLWNFQRHILGKNGIPYSSFSEFWGAGPLLFPLFWFQNLIRCPTQSDRLAFVPYCFSMNPRTSSSLSLCSFVMFSVVSFGILS